jgi:hypothetical protein
MKLDKSSKINKKLTNKPLEKKVVNKQMEIETTPLVETSKNLQNNHKVKKPVVTKKFVTEGMKDYVELMNSRRMKNNKK